MSRNRSKSAFFKGVGHFECRFQREGASPTNHCWCQKTRVIVISCGMKISAVLHLVLSIHASDRQTDGRTDKQTDRISTAIPCVALHVVAR